VVKKSRKVAPKSKEVLSDTDMEIDADTQKEKMPTTEGAMTKGMGKAKVKAKVKDVEAKVTGKGKGKAPVPAPDDDEDFNLNVTDVSDDPAVDVSFIPQFSFDITNYGFRKQKLHRCPQSSSAVLPPHRPGPVRRPTLKPSEPLLPCR